MPSSVFTCRECGVSFRRVATEWRRDETLICPNCGGVDLVVVLDPVRRWRSTGERRLVRGDPTPLLPEDRPAGD